MDVIVLAGTAKQSELTQSEGVSNKAFIQIHGNAMLSYVVAALQQVDQVQKNVVVGPEREIKSIFTPSDDIFVQLDNLLKHVIRCDAGVINADCLEALKYSAENRVSLDENRNDILDNIENLVEVNLFETVTV